MRSAGRTKEIALRIALGASRGRIIRQLLAESFMLAMLGGVFGLALAAAGTNGIARLVPIGALAGANINLNGRVLLFAAGAVVLSALLFGLAPALQSTKAGVQSELKDGGRTTAAGAGQNRWRATLAVAEISLALVLLVGAGLMMKSLGEAQVAEEAFREAVRIYGRRLKKLDPADRDWIAQAERNLA